MFEYSKNEYNNSCLEYKCTSCHENIQIDIYKILLVNEKNLIYKILKNLINYYIDDEWNEFISNFNQF